ncbi:helix-turn-helix domain-containing protein [Haloarchaeobius sp. DFWS5]|uniref:helix-turn-helix domain-containing protein n=1 Tax=Haloarchaeobius sp. DFWS5 TaxID=3446114 RepID=UPI003EC1232B
MDTEVAPAGTGAALVSAGETGITREVYDLTTVVRVVHPDLPLRPTTAAVPSVSIDLGYQTTDNGTTVLFFSAAGEDLDEFESALQRDPTVESPRVEAEHDGSRDYRVEFGDCLRVQPRLVESDARITATEVTSSGWRIEFDAPNRDALSALSDFCSANGVRLQVRKVSTGDERELDGALGMEECRKELLRTAFSEGYFDVPRKASQDELAETFDVSRSAISQQLRTVTRDLVSRTLTVDDDSTPAQNRFVSKSHI